MRTIALYVAVVTVFLMSKVRTSDGISYDQLRDMVMFNANFVQQVVEEKKVACDAKRCSLFEQLCQHGGKCVVTPTCECKCECPPGYKGYFCEQFGPHVEPTTAATVVPSSKTPTTAPNLNGSKPTPSGPKGDKQMSGTSAVNPGTQLSGLIRRTIHGLLSKDNKVTKKPVKP